MCVLIYFVVPVKDLKELLLPGTVNTPLMVSFNPEKDVAVLPYSSGTTGLNKGVMLTHANLVANVLQIAAMPRVLIPDDVYLAFLPFFHIYGMIVILCGGIYAGNTIVTMPKFDLQGIVIVIKFAYRIFTIDSNAQGIQITLGATCCIGINQAANCSVL